MCFWRNWLTGGPLLFKARLYGSGAPVPPYLFTTLCTSCLISASDGICYCIPRTFFIGAPFYIVWFLSSFSPIFIFLLILLMSETVSSIFSFSSFWVPFDSFDFFKLSFDFTTAGIFSFEPPSARSQLWLRSSLDFSSRAKVSCYFNATIFSNSWKHSISSLFLNGSICSLDFTDALNTLYSKIPALRDPSGNIITPIPSCMPCSHVPI